MKPWFAWIHYISKSLASRKSNIANHIHQTRSTTPLRFWSPTSSTVENSPAPNSSQPTPTSKAIHLSVPRLVQSPDDVPSTVTTTSKWHMNILTPMCGGISAS